MADRLTQLQDAVNQQADNFTNSLGILQQFSNPTPFSGLAQGNKSKVEQHKDHTNLFSQLIAHTAKDIELLIDSLPSEESSSELQASSLQKLEKENAEAAKKLEEVVSKGEATLKEIQAALHDIAQAQMRMEQTPGEASSNGAQILEQLRRGQGEAKDGSKGAQDEAAKARLARS